ncbi:hypothetical protein [uncultured Brachybacterium sp.]|uniref:hypothetical protein n=1 Tax=uncultured Brachybacterium sp. TaxID=189680 RepID=UPI00261D166E|nr:hypothetical protein [uncultured Brachybacterium sp.]
MTQPPSQQPSPGPLSPRHGVPAQGGIPSPGAPGPQGSGPQGGFSARQGGSTAPAKKPSRVPKVLIILGSVILALSVIIGLVLAIIGIGGAAGSAGALTHFDDGVAHMEIEADETLQIYVEEGTAVPSCTIEGPSEDAVGEGSSQNSRIGTGDANWVSVDSFTANEAGEYSIDCGGTPIAVGPPVSIGGIFAGIGGIFLGIGGGALGFLLLAIGVVLLIMRRSRA